MRKVIFTLTIDDGQLVMIFEHDTDSQKTPKRVVYSVNPETVPKSITNFLIGNRLPDE